MYLRSFTNSSNEIFSFETFKEKVTKLPMLAFHNFTKVFQVDCDANGSVVGIVSSREGKPIDFYSFKLNDAKRKYLIYDQELYENTQALPKRRHYLIPKDCFIQ